MAFALKDRQTVVFIGDSITDCGRRDTHVPLGDGYVRMISDMITARYPQLKLQLINSGIGGNNVRDLSHRWSDDVVCYKPHWVSIKVGINDVHSWLNKVEDRSVSPTEYAELYGEILERTIKQTRAKLILMDPFYISTDRTVGSFRRDVLRHLPSYIRIVRRMARKYQARHVKTHQSFANLLKYHPPDRFCPEPVHPYASGHLVMAMDWLKAMGW